MIIFTGQHYRSIGVSAKDTNCIVYSKLLEVQVLQAYKLTCVILEKYDQKRAKFNPNAK